MLRYITSLDEKNLPILDKKVLKDTNKKQNEDYYIAEEVAEDDNLPF